MTLNIPRCNGCEYSRVIKTDSAIEPVKYVYCAQNDTVINYKDRAQSPKWCPRRTETK